MQKKDIPTGRNRQSDQRRLFLHALSGIKKERLKASPSNDNSVSPTPHESKQNTAGSRDHELTKHDQRDINHDLEKQDYPINQKVICKNLDNFSNKEKTKFHPKTEKRNGSNSTVNQNNVWNDEKYFSPDIVNNIENCYDSVAKSQSLMNPLPIQIENSCFDWSPGSGYKSRSSSEDFEKQYQLTNQKDLNSNPYQIEDWGDKKYLASDGVNKIEKCYDFVANFQNSTSPLPFQKEKSCFDWSPESGYKSHSSSENFEKQDQPRNQKDNNSNCNQIEYWADEKYFAFDNINTNNIENYHDCVDNFQNLIILPPIQRDNSCFFSETVCNTHLSSEEKESNKQNINHPADTNEKIKTKMEPEKFYLAKVRQLYQNNKKNSKRKKKEPVSSNSEINSNFLLQSKFCPGENSSNSNKGCVDSFSKYLSDKNNLPEYPFEDTSVVIYAPVPKICSPIEGTKGSYEEVCSVNKEINKRNSSLSPIQVEFQEISLFLKDIESKSYKNAHIAKKVVSDVNSVVRYYFQGEKVVLYGSYLSQVAVNTSNINLAFKTSQLYKNSLMELLRKHLKDDKSMKNYDIEPFEPAERNRKAKIHFTESDFGIACEISFAGRTIEKHIKMNEMLKKLCKIDARIKTLIISSRIFAEECGIHEEESGKLHTIGFSVMMIYFLQQLENPMLPLVNVACEEFFNDFSSKNQACLGELWLDFLEFYSNKFDWENDVVCITSESKVSKKDKKWTAHLIAIEDPLTQKNIAESVRKREIAEHIQSCFKEMHKHFLELMKDSGSDSSCSSEEGDDENTYHGKYSFKSCKFIQERLPECEDCEELGGPCAKCLNLSTYNYERLPEICESSMIYVSKVLDEVFGKNILSENNIKGRNLFVQDLQRFIRHRFPTATLSLFGSSVNGFGFESSDLDMCLTFQSKMHADEVQILRQVSSCLRRDKQSRYKSVICLYRAIIPLIQFSTEPCLNWKCDISLNNILPVHNSKLLNAYATFDIRCRKLGCALKLLAKKTGLMESRMTSLSSYSYILMTIHYLQQSDPPVLPVFPIHQVEVFSEKIIIPKEIKKHNYWCYEDQTKLQSRYPDACKNYTGLGELWLGLLDFYLAYDTEKFAITIIQKEPLCVSELDRCACLYSIQDPFIQDKNLGCRLSERTGYEVLHIFREARKLFGRKKPDSVTNLKDHYFSTMNLTGKYNVKEKDCPLCGVYGHDETQCRKFPCHQRGSL